MRDTVSDSDIRETYNQFREYGHSILDSIRFTAKALKLKTIDVASVLGFGSYFLEHR